MVLTRMSLVHVMCDVAVLMVQSLARGVSRWYSGPRFTITLDLSAVLHRRLTLQSLWWSNQMPYLSRRSKSSLQKPRFAIHCVTLSNRWELSHMLITRINLSAGTVLCPGCIIINPLVVEIFWKLCLMIEYIAALQLNRVYSVSVLCE